MDKLFNNEELLKISNNTTFLKYYNQFILLALNMFQGIIYLKELKLDI